MENPTPTSEQPLVQGTTETSKLTAKPRKKILVALGLLSMLLNTLVVGVGIRNGFEETDQGKKPTEAGTVCLIIINGMFMFFTLKIIFCIMNPTYPTWPELKELREAIRYMLATTLLGLALWGSAFDLHSNYRYLDKEAAPRGHGMHLDKAADEPIRNTDLKLPIMNEEYNGSLALNHSILESIDSSLVKERTPLDEGVFKEGSNNDNSTSQESEFLKSDTLPNNGDVDDEDSTFSSKFHGNKSKKEQGNHKDEKSFTSNLPVVTLFVCSFSFFLPLTIITIAISFEVETRHFLNKQVKNGIAMHSAVHEWWSRNNNTGPSSHNYWEINSNGLPTANFSVAPEGEDTVCQSRATGVPNVNGEDGGDGHGVERRQNSSVPHSRDSPQISHSSGQTVDSRPSLPPRPVNGQPPAIYPFSPNHVPCCLMACYPYYTHFHRVKAQTGAIPKQWNQGQGQPGQQGPQGSSVDILAQEELGATGGSSHQYDQLYEPQNQSSVSTVIVNTGSTEQLIQAASGDLATGVALRDQETEHIEMTPK